MKRTRIILWLGAGVLATAAGAGCEHADTPRSAYAQTPNRSRMYSKYDYPNSRGTQVTSAAPQTVPVNPALVAESAEPVVQPEAIMRPPREEAQVAMEPPAPPAPPVEAVLPPPLPKEEMPERTVAAAPPADPVAVTPPPPAVTEVRTIQTPEPVVRTVSHNIPSDRPAPRRSYVDSTASPCFSHSEDYRSLTGQLQHSRLSKSWRLRYASVDETDPFGGSVTLVEDERLHNLKDGQFVRILGRFLNPDEKGIAPAYQIESLQPIGDGR
jgi:hypothetical protein